MTRPSPARTGGYPAPALLEPLADTTLSGQTTFSWTWKGPALQPNQAFEVRLWKEGQSDHYGAAEPVRTTSAALNVQHAHGVQQGQNGAYLWTVALVEVNPYRQIGPEAPPSRVYIQVTAGGGPPPPTLAPP